MKSKTTAFEATLSRHDLELRRDRCQTLQVNVGLRCDLACRHCHLSAGPGCTEICTAGADFTCGGEIAT